MAKHEKTYVDFDQPYEQNIIGVRGIVYFAVGLFLLIVVTFALMWIFQFQVLQPQAEALDNKDKNPMAMSEQERIPKNLQLQGAPGFGVEGPDGVRINLELREPQAEYWELQKQWKVIWEKGQVVKDANGKETVVTLPIEKAKEKLLADKSIKTNSSKEAENDYQQSKKIVSASSAGRTASDTRR